MSYLHKLKFFYHQFNFNVNFILKFLLSNNYLLLRRIHIMDSIDTVNYLLKNKVSISRFGDGEFDIINNKGNGFQCESPKLARKLVEVATVELPNHSVALPYVWKNMRNLKYDAYCFWAHFLVTKFKNCVVPYLSNNREYLDTNFTRFYIDYKNPTLAQKLIPLIKKLWDKKNICIIEGERSRLGVGNDLFSNTESVNRIICPAENAFDVYETILDSVKKNNCFDLYLISLGMTATCLSYDMSKLGMWAIDVGHIDIEYEWFKMNAKKKIAVKGKYVNEAGGYMPFDNESVLTQYNSEIICRIRK